MDGIVFSVEHPKPTIFTSLTEQPVEFVGDECGAHFRAICLQHSGDTVPQHVHDYDHATLIASGAARLWINGEWAGDHVGFKVLKLDAGREHIFQALLPQTRIVCVHVLNGKQYEFMKEGKL